MCVSLWEGGGGVISNIYIIILDPDDRRRPCVAMTPWLTPHSGATGVLNKGGGATGFLV